MSLAFRKAIIAGQTCRELKMNKLIIDLSLNNEWLYAGCHIEDVAGRLNLTTPVAEAIGVVGRNIHQRLKDVDRKTITTATLTGPMAVWSYLVVFHAVVHQFQIIEYDDGRSGAVIIAKHG